MERLFLSEERLKSMASCREGMRWRWVRERWVPGGVHAATKPSNAGHIPMACIRGIHKDSNSPRHCEKRDGQSINRPGKPLDIGKGEAKTARISREEKKFSKTAHSQTTTTMDNLWHRNQNIFAIRPASR